MVRTLVVLLVAATPGCTTTATIVTTERTLEARLEKGDAEHLPVVTEWGHREVLLRKDLRDVDHPGNVLAVVGGILAGSGLIDLLGASSLCFSGGSARSSVCATFLAPVLIGLPMLVWGFWAWTNSRAAVEPAEGVLAPLPGLPCPDASNGAAVPRPDESGGTPPPPPPPPAGAPLSAPPQP